MNRQELDAELPTIDKNIAAVHSFRKTSDEKRRLDQKFVDEVAAFLGSTKSLYLHLCVYGIWVALHFTGVLHIAESKVSIEYLSMIASLDALFLSVFVLINQRRMAHLERKNSDLHLQVSLLAEQELTKLVQVTDLMAAHLGVKIESVEGLEDVKKDVGPNEILERISEHENNSPTSSTAGDEDL